MTRQVRSRIETAAALCAQRIRLIIPSYQRPYVWPAEDITQLFDDIVAACQAGERHYYIGTIITADSSQPYQDGSTCQELIDGQQRITTLMLLSLAMTKALPETSLAQFVTLNDHPRLIFRIREQVQAYLGAQAGLSGYRDPEDVEMGIDDYLRHLHRALKASHDAVRKFKDRHGETGLAEVADFLFSRVKWVNNTMPAGVNLNRLFAKINTSGVQLEQSDILKSQLLRRLGKNKARYEAMWQACENMSNYFERNVRKLFPQADWQNLAYEDLARFDPARFPQDDKDGDGDAWVSLADLVKDPSLADAVPQRTGVPGIRKDGESKPEDDSQDEKIFCRPIIGFALLLMHAYRVYLARQDRPADIPVRLNVARFGECFDTFVAHADETDVRSFIECLWEVRYQFDTWVVKWIVRDGEEEAQLRLSTVSRATETNGGKRLTRNFLETNDLSQLQAVRNFTGERSAQYWLTPLLGALAETRPHDAASVLALLEGIDNQMSLASCTQKEASFSLLTGAEPPCETFSSVRNMLANSNKGTGFEHYWFQKLEYILWKNRHALGLEPHKWERFRITSKNSVEHVHPQNHEYREEIGDFLDSFGNLVLLSPGENSSYSNQDPQKKRVDFHKKPTYDALKLACMFRTVGQGSWIDGIKLHQEEMIGLIGRHYRE